jgi:ribosome-binding factor A
MMRTIMRRHFTLRRIDEGTRSGRFADDGRESTDVGPRRGRSSRRSGSDSALDRKTMQLCHQVAVTLDEVLAECGDPLLQGLRVVDVEPSPDVSRLLVTVTLDGEPVDCPETLHRVEAHLARASGHLRGEVAQAITRKRAPALVYHLTPAETTIEFEV